MGDVLVSDSEATTESEPVFRRHRFDVYDYHRMTEAGLLHEDSRVELIDGDLIDMHAIGSDHSGTVNYLTERLVLALTGRAIVGVQNPVRLGDWSEPQPDFSVMRHRADHYRRATPLADEVLMLIEVANSSGRYDRTVKAPLYARHGVPELWIVDVVNLHVSVYRDPGPDGYRSITQHGPDDTIAPLAAPDLLIELRAIIG